MHREDRTPAERSLDNLNAERSRLLDKLDRTGRLTREEQAYLRILNNRILSARRNLWRLRGKL